MSVILAHKGAPCMPPIVNGITFSPLGEDDIWVGEASEEQAVALTRNPAFNRYGGALAPAKIPSPDPDVLAAQQAADAAEAAAREAEAAEALAASEVAAKEAEALAAESRLAAVSGKKK